jgi:Spy/CpxP family protein refolding chaperone
MKKTTLIFTLLILIFISNGIKAQTTTEVKQGKTEAHENPADKLKSELKLTSSQYESVKKVFVEAKAARQKNEETYKNDQGTLQKVNKEVRDETEAKIMAILDPVQKANYLSMKEKKKEEHRSESSRDKAIKKTGELNAALKLTPEQAAKINEIFVNGFTKIDVAKAKYKEDEEAAKAEIKPIKKEMEKNILSVLTNEQKVAYKEYKEKKKGE